DGQRLLEGVTDQQILNDVPSHRRAMMRPVLKAPEFCGACHKSQVPRELNDYKFLRAFMVADELQQSSFLRARQRDLQFVSYEARTRSALRRFCQERNAGLASLGHRQHGHSDFLQ